MTRHLNHVPPNMGAPYFPLAGEDTSIYIPMRKFGNKQYQRLASAESRGNSEDAARKGDEELSPEVEVSEDAEPGSATSLLDSGKSKSLTLGLTLGVPGEEKRFWFQRSKAVYDPDAIATQPSVFDNPETLEEYRPSDEWENSHRFDPDERWTWVEEHRLIRKIDIKIMCFAAIMFMALELDRSNISQALTDNFLEDLGMNTNGKRRIVTIQSRTESSRL